MKGWDPIFEYEGKTYAEMDKEEKVGWSEQRFLLANIKVDSTSRTKFPTDTKLS